MKFELHGQIGNVGHQYKALERWMTEEEATFYPGIAKEVPHEAARFIIEKAPELKPADEEAEAALQEWLEERKGKMCPDCFSLSPWLYCDHQDRQDRKQRSDSLWQLRLPWFNLQDMTWNRPPGR